jgi:hypothetical protein
LDTIAISSAVISTNSSGVLKLIVPDLTKQNPDYSYKIEYVGLKKSPKDSN